MSRTREEKLKERPGAAWETTLRVVEGTANSATGPKIWQSPTPWERSRPGPRPPAAPEPETED